MSDNNDERAAFEAAMRAEYNLAWCESLFAREGEDHSNPATQLAFAAWRLGREALKREGVVVPRECEWSYDDADSAWLTSCGEEFCFMDGGPNENKAKFCQYCGGKINVSADASKLGQLAGEGE